MTPHFRGKALRCATCADVRGGLIRVRSQRRRGHPLAVYTAKRSLSLDRR